LGPRHLEDPSPDGIAVAVSLGSEWIVDAHGCPPGPLRSREALQAVFDALVRDLGLHPVAEAVWHVFPEPGGVTGLLLLSESHLACHTFPERGFAAFNLYCCRPRPEWPWSERLRELIGAREIALHLQPRGER
jgi:S-adenosylmethionine decarboxylase